VLWHRESDERLRIWETLSTELRCLRLNIQGSGLAGLNQGGVPHFGAVRRTRSQTSRLGHSQRKPALSNPSMGLERAFSASSSTSLRSGQARQRAAGGVCWANPEMNSRVSADGEARSQCDLDQLEAPDCIEA